MSNVDREYAKQRNELFVRMNEEEYARQMEEKYAEANAKIKCVNQKNPDILRDRYTKELESACGHLRQALAISAELAHPAFVLRGLVEAIESASNAKEIAP